MGCEGVLGGYGVLGVLWGYGVCGGFMVLWGVRGLMGLRGDYRVSRILWAFLGVLGGFKRFFRSFLKFFNFQFF